LLYTDDIVIMSETEEGLNTRLMFCLKSIVTDRNLL